MRLELPEGLTEVALDTETSGLHPDDGARVSVVVLGWRDSSGETVSRALPFDQGIRDKVPGRTPELFADPNLGSAEWSELLVWLGRQRLVFHNAKFDLHLMRAGTRQFGGRDLPRR